MKIGLAYGRLNVEKNFVISESEFKCKSETNLLEEYPVVIFDCNLSSNDKKKTFRSWPKYLQKRVKLEFWRQCI